jgi:hypothetical protein
MKEEHTLLHEPIELIATSDEFLEMCQLNNFKTLNEILELPVNEMLLKPKFGMRMLKELYSILKSNRLEKYLKE